MTAQLKTLQEVITLTVFSGFSVLYLKEQRTWNHAAGFALIAAGAGLIFHGRDKQAMLCRSQRRSR